MTEEEAAQIGDAYLGAVRTLCNHQIDLLKAVDKIAPGGLDELLLLPQTVLATTESLLKLRKKEIDPVAQPDK